VFFKEEKRIGEVPLHWEEQGEGEDWGVKKRKTQGRKTIRKLLT